MYNSKFWKDAFERAVSTFFQFAAVLIPANLVSTQVDWSYILLFCFLGFMAAMVKSIAFGFANNGNPSAVGLPEFTKKGRHSI